MVPPHREIFSVFFFVFFVFGSVTAPEALSAPSEALPAASEALPVASEALPALSEALLPLSEAISAPSKDLLRYHRSLSPTGPPLVALS